MLLTLTFHYPLDQGAQITITSMIVIIENRKMSTLACQGLTKVDQEDVTLTPGDTGSKASVLTA